MMTFCFILRFISLSVYKAKTNLKAVKVSIYVSNVSCKSCTLLFYATKDKFTRIICVYFHKTFFSQAHLIWARNQMCLKSVYHCQNRPKILPFFWKGLWSNCLISTLRLGFLKVIYSGRVNMTPPPPLFPKLSYWKKTNSRLI